MGPTFAAVFAKRTCPCGALTPAPPGSSVLPFGASCCSRGSQASINLSVHVFLAIVAARSVSELAALCACSRSTAAPAPGSWCTGMPVVSPPGPVTSSLSAAVSLPPCRREVAHGRLGRSSSPGNPALAFGYNNYNLIAVKRSISKLKGVPWITAYYMSAARARLTCSRPKHASSSLFILLALAKCQCLVDPG